MRSHNKLTLPGFVCAHTHLYSSLALGMPAPAEAPRSFVEILERVWWRLDRALDAAAVAEVGLRAVVCYEVTDRNGPDEARAGIRENDRFLARIRREPPHLVRAMVGAHAAFTLSDETAEAIADVARRHRAGVHIHVAED